MKITTKQQEREQPRKNKGLDSVHLYYCIFVAVIISLLTGAFRMGAIAFVIFVMLSASFLYVLWMVYILLSRIFNYLYRTYLRGYLSGIKRAKQDLEKR